MAEAWERFILREVVGVGGISAVHRAIDRRTGNTVALKKLRADRADSRELFEVERAALASLDHPGIVNLLAHGETSEGQPFLAMEWLDGEDLAARLTRGPLTPYEAALLGAQVAGALSAAHSRGIVHRDVKPGNLFLLGGRPDRVKVLDFGIARIPGRSVSTRETLLGTPSYIAPEQARSETDTDARADLFSLGTVLFECLTGSPPFQGEHLMAVLAKVLLEEAPLVSKLCPEAPEALARLVDRLLAKDPGARPQSAGEVAAALERLTGGMEAGDAAGSDVTKGVRESPRLLVRERRFITIMAIRSDAVIAAEIAPSGCRVDRLANGTLLISWMGAEDSTERTTRAARFALLVRDLVPSSAIAVTTVMSDGTEPRPIGQALDRAASLLAPEEGVPPPGIRLDLTSARLLDPRFQVVHRAGGFELIGEEEISKGERLLLGRPSPFAGREWELRTLLDLVGECAPARAARAVLVTAAAGAGKTRLAHELRRALTARGMALEVWMARADCMSAGAAFAAIGSALRNTANIRSGDPLPERQHQLAERVSRHVPEPDRARVTAFLGELAGVPFPDSYCPLLGPARHSAAAMAERTRRAWEDFVAAECAAHPVLLVLDDLHWGDAPSVNLLDVTLGALRSSPLFVLALGRPETQDIFPKLWAERGVQEVRLGGLSPRAAEGLVRTMLGDSIDATLTARIVERAGGNAFYLEEMIRAAAEGGLRELPTTVLATVQARLDMLPEEERAVLRAATVFGEIFWLSGVEALLEGTELAPRAATCLRALVAREILVRSVSSRYPGEREFAFRHALLREGAYALLAEPDRVTAHGCAAQWLEEMGESEPVLLAEHYEQGRMIERAARYRLLAAEQALASNDPRSAILHAERATPSARDGERLLRRAHLLNESYWILGNTERAKETASVLLKLSPPGSEPWCNAIGVQMILSLQSGAVETLYATITRFLVTPIAQERSEWVARLYGLMAIVLSFTGLRGPTAHCVERAEKAAESDPPDPTTQWFVCTARAQWSFFFEGNFLAAVGEHQRALACCEQSGRRQYDVFNHGFLSWTYIMLGAQDRAEAHARRALETSPRGSMAGLMGQLSLCWLSTVRGAVAEALILAQDAFAAAPGDVHMAGMAKVAWGYALIWADRWQEAAPQTREALQLLTGAPMLHALAQVQHCDLLRIQGHLAEALRALLPLLGSRGEVVIHPMALAYARMKRIELLEALRDHRALDAALREERERILASAARIPEPSLRASFLRSTPWNALILAKAAERLPGADPS